MQLKVQMKKHSEKNKKSMLSILTWFLLFFFSTWHITANADPARHLVWQKVPLSIDLPIGQEKILSFPTDVTPYFPDGLMNQKALSVINNAGTLYLTAKQAFPATLIEVRLHNTAGTVILLSIEANPQASDTPIDIVLAAKKTASIETTTSTNSLLNVDDAANQDASLGQLVQFVAQQLYAPRRLLHAPASIFRVPMHTMHFVNLYEGGAVSAMPLASWRSGNLYATAVLLRNVEAHQPVVLNPQLLRGNWVALSFFRMSRLNPAILTKAHTMQDSTTAILISAHPFAAALKGISDV